MRFVLHSFFSVMLATLVAGLGVAYFKEFTHRARLQEQAARPCDTGKSSARPDCPAPAVVSEDSRPGPLPPLVLPQINALEISPLPDRAEVAPPEEPLDMQTGAARVQEPVAVLSIVEPPAAASATISPVMPAFQELTAPPDPAKSFTPLSSAAIPPPESPVIVPPFTAPVTPPPSLAQPTPPASPGGVTPQAKTTPDRRAPARPARRSAERRPVAEDIIQPEFDSAPVRASPRVAPQPPRAVPSAPLLLPGAVEPTNTPRE
jgi:hypothetical protein